MFYILDFVSHQFYSASYPEEAIATAKMAAQGRGEEFVEIVLADDDTGRFTIDEFVKDWS